MTNEKTQAAMVEHMLQQIIEPQPKLVDYWCRDCQGWFFALYEADLHTPAFKCPKCGGHQTYEACTE